MSAFIYKVIVRGKVYGEATTLAEAEAAAKKHGGKVLQEMGKTSNPGAPSGERVGDTILRQLGGANRLKAMINANTFLAHPDGIEFWFSGPEPRKRGNNVFIRLEPGDTYSAGFYYIPKSGLVSSYKDIHKYTGIHVEQLMPLLERHTGLAWSLGSAFNSPKTSNPRASSQKMRTVDEAVGWICTHPESGALAALSNMVGLINGTGPCQRVWGRFFYAVPDASTREYSIGDTALAFLAVDSDGRYRWRDDAPCKQPKTSNPRASKLTPFAQAWFALMRTKPEGSYKIPAGDLREMQASYEDGDIDDRALWLMVPQPSVQAMLLPHKPPADLRRASNPHEDEYIPINQVRTPFADAWFEIQRHPTKHRAALTAREMADFSRLYRDGTINDRSLWLITPYDDDRAKLPYEPPMGMRAIHTPPSAAHKPTAAKKPPASHFADTDRGLLPAIYDFWPADSKEMSRGEHMILASGEMASKMRVKDGKTYILERLSDTELKRLAVACGLTRRSNPPLEHSNAAALLDTVKPGKPQVIHGVKVSRVGAGYSIDRVVLSRELAIKRLEAGGKVGNPAMRLSHAPKVSIPAPEGTADGQRIAVAKFADPYVGNDFVNGLLFVVYDPQTLHVGGTQRIATAPGKDSPDYDGMFPDVAGLLRDSAGKINAYFVDGKTANPKAKRAALAAVDPHAAGFIPLISRQWGAYHSVISEMERDGPEIARALLALTNSADALRHQRPGLTPERFEVLQAAMREMGKSGKAAVSVTQQEMQAFLNGQKVFGKVASDQLRRRASAALAYEGKTANPKAKPAGPVVYI